MSDLRNFNNFTMLKMFNLDEKNIQKFKVYDLKYDEAKYKINQLIERFKNSNIPKMNDFANTLINWKNEIVNSFLIVGKNEKKISNAIIENRNKSI